MSWLDELIEASSEAETPKQWIYWSGISTISAIISPNVFINRGGVYRLSPNVFIMLIGESGIGKGFPIAISRRLVRLIDTTRVISGMNTIQAILKELGTSESNEKTGEVKFKDARAYIVSGEFSTLLAEDKKALPVITELYDTHYAEDWKNSTKNSGVDTLKNVSVTLFGGSTPEHFSAVVPEADVKGGFVGRILTCYEETRSRINPLSNTDAENDFPYQKLTEHLKLISMVHGPFRYAPNAKKYWEDWYVAIRSKKVHDPTGAVNRLPDNVLKVAMCLALAKKPELVIELDDLEESIEKCMHLTIDSRRLTGGKGQSQLGQGAHLVIQTLFKAEDHAIMKSKLLQLHYGQFDIYELDRIIQTLETSELIISRQIDGKTQLIMPDQAVQSIKKLMER